MAARFALIIGNSRYDDPSLGRLPASDAEIQALAEVLRDPNVGHFDEVITLLNEGCASVRKAVSRFYNQRRRDDLLLLYFSGHGVKDEQGRLYLAVRDTEIGLLAGTAIEAAFITGHMDRSFSKRQVLALDCCYSGQGVSVGTADAFEGTGLGRVIVTANESTQSARDCDSTIGDEQRLLFTHFLIDGLKTGAADRNEDGVVTVDELYDYVREQMVNITPRQTPHKWTYRQEDEIVLALNPMKRSTRPPEPEAETRAENSASDIFISYAREDREKARALANLLAARGWKVWWDRKIAPGEAFDEVIERELGTCQCTIVLWSARSVNATWVRNEARRAAGRKVLVPILIDAVETPLEFENLQAADLTDWKADADHPELEALIDRIQALSPMPAERLSRSAVADPRRESAARRLQATLEREHAESARREAQAAQRQREAGATTARIEGLLEQRDLDAAERSLAIAEKRLDPAEYRPLRERLEVLRGEADREELARTAVEHARRQFAAGHRQAALASLEQYRPAPDLVARALIELRAEAERIERQQAESAHREADAARGQHDVDAGTAVEGLVRPPDLNADEPALATGEKVVAAAQTGRRVDEDVQFSVYRPAVVVPQRWYPMLAFAHLAKQRRDAAIDEPDPFAEMEQQAQRILGDRADEFDRVSVDSGQPIPHRGRLRIVPIVPGVEFNPPERSFLWLEQVHREEFHLRAGLDMDGRTVRGVVSVYLDWLRIADIAIAISVDRRAGARPAPAPAIAHPYRRIFASYSHLDAAVVRQFEDYARGFGDRYMRDVIELRSGEVWNRRLAELIESADVFQLFWSWNSMSSPFVRSEWEHALKMNREYFIRPVYWEEPFPERRDLPPDALRALQFAHVGPLPGRLQPPSVPLAVSPGPATHPPRSEEALRSAWWVATILLGIAIVLAFLVMRSC